ncbi:MAG: hypothetical protein ABSA41_22800, partial [Terriglobia bacterium]
HHDLLARAEEDYPQASPLLQLVMREGRRLAPPPRVEEIRKRTLANLACLPEAYQALRAAPAYPVEKSASLQQLLEEIRVLRFGAMKASHPEGGR